MLRKLALLTVLLLGVADGVPTAPCRELDILSTRGGDDPCAGHRCDTDPCP